MIRKIISLLSVLVISFTTIPAFAGNGYSHEEAVRANLQDAMKKTIRERMVLPTLETYGWNVKTASVEILGTPGEEILSDGSMVFYVAFSAKFQDWNGQTGQGLFYQPFQWHKNTTAKKMNMVQKGAAVISVPDKPDSESEWNRLATAYEQASQNLALAPQT